MVQASSATMLPIIELKNVSKRFAGIKALDGVSIESTLARLWLDW